MYRLTELARREGLKGNPLKERPRLRPPLIQGSSRATGLRATSKGGRAACGREASGSTGVVAPAPALRAGCCGQAALVLLPPPGRKMWEPRAATSPLPQTRLLLIKPLSICRRLHGSGPSALAQRWRYRRAD